MKIFNIDGPLYRFLEKIGNLIILNLLLVVCSLPIVTIGPALTATYYVCLKMLRNEETGIIKSFFHSFKMNFKQGLILGVCVTVLAVLLMLDIHVLTYLISIPEAIAKVLLVITCLLLLVLFIISLYLFAILAQFDSTTPNLLRWSAALAISHFPVTLVSALIAASPILILFFFVDIFVQFGIPIMMLLGFSGVVFLQSYFYVKVFDRYIPKEDTDEDK